MLVISAIVTALLFLGEVVPDLRGVVVHVVDLEHPQGRNVRNALHYSDQLTIYFHIYLCAICSLLAFEKTTVFWCVKKPLVQVITGKYLCSPTSLCSKLLD